MRLAIMNIPCKSSHNANLPVTIAKNGRIVNPITQGVIEADYDDTIVENATEVVFESWEVLTRENQASVLFVKISNSIFQFQLKPKVIELYILLAYIIKAEPKFRFSCRSIVSEYKSITKRIINKDTVNLYINILINKGLLKKGKNKNYLLGTNLELRSPVKPPLNSNSELQLRETRELRMTVSDDYESNYYQVPKNRYTNFYIKIYLDKLTKNEVILDHYIASLAYKTLRPTKVTREVNISHSTYFRLLRSLRSKSIIYRHYLFNKNLRYKKQYFYYSTKRNHLKKDYEDDKINRWYMKRDEVLESFNKPKPHKSKYWFTGRMGEYMKKYKIKYIKLFNNYELQDVLDVILELENQIGNSSIPYKMSAPLIVKALKEGWNWDRVVARRHNNIKKLANII
jgi:predicted transcriptional regulator